MQPSHFSYTGIPPKKTISFPVTDACDVSNYICMKKIGVHAMQTTQEKGKV